MKVALLAPLVTPLLPDQRGGSQALVVDLAQGLLNRGHDVTLFAASGSNVRDLPIEEVSFDGSRMSQNLFRAQDGWRRTEVDVLHAAFGRAYDQISSGTFDVVHNHGFDPPAFTEANRAGYPVVHTLHLPYDEEIARSIDLRDPRSAPSLIVAVSNAHGIEWGARVDRVVTNGIPVALIPWSTRRERSALFAGRLSPEKGVAEAVEIARRAQVPLAIAGSDYDASYAAEVRAHAGGDVAFLGSIPRSRLWELMSNAGVLLSPSRWNEPFGLAAAEAQAAGCPVVAFDRGALSEVVEDGVTGFIVPEGDLDAAAHAVHAALGLNSSAVRASAERRLDIVRMVAGYEALYMHIAALGSMHAN